MAEKHVDVHIHLNDMTRTMNRTCAFCHTFVKTNRLTGANNKEFDKILQTVRAYLPERKYTGAN